MNSSKAAITCISGVLLKPALVLTSWCLPFFCEEPTLFIPYVGFVFPQLWVSFSLPAVSLQLSRTITQQSSVSCVLEMRVETTNAVQVAKNVTTATVEPSGNWYPQLWLSVSACQNASSACFPSQSADRSYCCCSRSHRWGGTCVPRCPHQCRYGVSLVSQPLPAALQTARWESREAGTQQPGSGCSKSLQRVTGSWQGAWSVSSLLWFIGGCSWG